MALPIYDDIPELSADAKAIARRRKIAESMMAQSQAPLETNQMAGGYVVPVSWTQGLAKMAQAYLGNKTDEEADKSERGLADRYKKNVADELARARAIELGTPAIEGIQAQPERTIQAPAPMQQGQVAPNYGTVPETVPAVAGREAVPAVAGDKRRANEMLVASAYPELHRMQAQRNIDDALAAKDVKDQDKYSMNKGYILNQRTGAYQKIDGYDAGSEDGGTPDIKNYEYAVKHGYKGSLTDYIQIKPQAMMPVAMGNLAVAQGRLESDRREDDYKLPAQTPKFSVSVGGKTYSFKDQKSLNNFKSKAGVQ